MKLTYCIICHEMVSSWVVYHSKSGFCKCRNCTTSKLFNYILFPGEIRKQLENGEYYTSNVSQ